MADDLYERWGDLLHETPEAEEALRAWRDRKTREALKRKLHEKRVEILVKHLAGHPPYD